MGFIVDMWNTFLYDPLMNGLILIYQVVPGASLGISIILFTVLTRIVLFPLTKKNRQYQLAMQKLQPELEKLRKKYPDDKERLYKETLALYQKHKASPTAGCLPLLIQLPFTIALYIVLRNGLDAAQIDTVNNTLYSFVPHLTSLNTNFLWFDLALPDPFYILPVLVGGTQFLQTRVSMARMSGQAAQTMKQTMIFMPLILMFITLSLPSGLTFYILLTTIFSIAEFAGRKGLSNPKTLFFPPQESVEITADDVVEGEVVVEEKPKRIAPKSKKKKK